jgi:hypothetical protein
LFAACFAACYSRDIYVNTTTQIMSAMKEVLPGDNVIVVPGRYRLDTQTQFYWNIKAVGTSDKPISLRCAEPGLCIIDNSLIIGGSSYFTLSGFRLGRSSTFQALSVEGCDHISLSSIDIQYGDDENLWLLRSSFCTLDSVTFSSSKEAIQIDDCSDISIKSSTIRDGSRDKAVYVRNSTRVEFAQNLFICETMVEGGSWIFEDDAGGNLFDSNSFGFVFAKYQRKLNGYLVDGNKYGPSTLSNNYMDLKNGIGFAGCKDYKNRVCKSNVVDGGATFTDGDVDPSC